MLSRVEAQIAVDGVTYRVGVFAAVSHEDCLRLLGESRFALLVADPVRNLGPVPQTVYPWNVVDYLSSEDPLSLARRRVAAKPQE